MAVLSRTPVPHHLAVPRARMAVSASFFILGAGTGLWAVHIPLVQARIGIDPGTFGLALFAMAVGAMISMPLTSLALSRFGWRLPAQVLAIGYPIVMPLSMLAPSTATLFVSLFLFGAAMGGLDVAMNTQATEIEAARGRPTMSSFHGFYSIGALCGAAAGSLIVAVGWGDGSGAILVAVVFFASAIAAAMNLLPDRAPLPGATTTTRRFTLPGRAVIALGMVAFLAFAAESAVTDWSALFLTTAKHAGPAAAGLGYAVFAVAMTAGRLTGDAVVHRLGAFLTVLGGGCLITLGIVLAIATQAPFASALAFLIVGVGAANLAPVAFGSAARAPGSSPAAAVTTVTALGYFGYLVFPPLIGFVAKSFGLSAGLWIVALMGLAISAMAGTMRR